MIRLVPQSPIHHRPAKRPIAFPLEHAHTPTVIVEHHRVQHPVPVHIPQSHIHRPVTRRIRHCPCKTPSPIVEQHTDIVRPSIRRHNVQVPIPVHVPHRQTLRIDPHTKILSLIPAVVPLAPQNAHAAARIVRHHNLRSPIPVQIRHHRIPRITPHPKARRHPKSPIPLSQQHVHIRTGPLRHHHVHMPVPVHIPNTHANRIAPAPHPVGHPTPKPPAPIPQKYTHTAARIIRRHQVQLPVLVEVTQPHVVRIPTTPRPAKVSTINHRPVGRPHSLHAQRRPLCNPPVAPVLDDVEALQGLDRERKLMGGRQAVPSPVLQARAQRKAVRSGLQRTVGHGVNRSDAVGIERVGREGVKDIIDSVECAVGPGPAQFAVGHGVDR